MSKHIIACDQALAVVMTDSYLVGKLAGGVHEGEASDPTTPGATTPRRDLPFLCYWHLGSKNYIGGGKGNPLCIDVDYYIRVYFDEATKVNGRLALLRLDELLIGQKLSTTVNSTDGQSQDDFDVFAGSFQIMAKSYHRENNGRRIIREGKRWTFRVHGV